MILKFAKTYIFVTAEFAKTYIFVTFEFAKTNIFESCDGIPVT